MTESASQPPSDDARVSTPGTKASSALPVILFFTDNGHGLGHITRLLAVASKASDRFQPFFLTMSTGYPVLWDGGIPVEFFPSYSQIGLTKRDWTPLLTARLSEAIHLTGAKVVVVDHVMPPTSFRDLRSVHPDVRFVWCRRGLWREGRNEEYLAMTGDFDLVVEPGDLAGPIDKGATATYDSEVVRVRPIVLVQPDEYASREEGRSALGIPMNGRAVLIQLSDSDPDKLRALITKVRDTLTAVGGTESIHAFAPVHTLHGKALLSVPKVIMAPVYPVARYFRAFDAVVSTAGYNSYHEIVASGLPAVFIARDTNSLDDQERRARFAQLCGRAFWAPSIDDAKFVRSVRRMLAPDEPMIAEATTRELGPMDGAEQFAALLTEQVEAVHSMGSAALSIHSEPRVAGIESQSRKSESQTSEMPETVLLNVIRHSTSDLDEVLTDVISLRNERPDLFPVFLTRAASPRPLADRDLVFESVVTPEAWSRLGSGDRYQDYLGRRIAGMISRYGTAAAFELAPGEPLPRALYDPGVVRSSTPSGPSRGGRDQPVPTGRRHFSLQLPSLDGGDTRRLTVDLPSHLYVPRLLEERGLAGYEASALACWLTILSLPGLGAAFDVGANVGPYSWLAAALSDRKVVAFEPVPELSDAVGTVAADNRLEIALERLALGSSNGTAPLYLSDQTDSSNSLVAGFRRSSRAIDVAIRTLDSYVESAGVTPFVLKMDTETTEPDILEGSKWTLSSHRPWLIVEVLSGRTEDRLMDLLDPFGYSWYPIDDRTPLEEAPRIVGDPTYKHTNWLFSPLRPDDHFWNRLSAWRRALGACGPTS